MAVKSMHLRVNFYFETHTHTHTLQIYLPLIIKASRACSDDYEMEDADEESMVGCVEFGERIS